MLRRQGQLNRPASEAFAAQAMQYFTLLQRYACALIGDAGAADDLVPDALERALVK